MTSHSTPSFDPFIARKRSSKSSCNGCGRSRSSRSSTYTELIEAISMNTGLHPSSFDEVSPNPSTSTKSFLPLNPTRKPTFSTNSKSSPLSTRTNDTTNTNLNANASLEMYKRTTRSWSKEMGKESQELNPCRTINLSSPFSRRFPSMPLHSRSSSRTFSLFKHLSFSLEYLVSSSSFAVSPSLSLLSYYITRRSSYLHLFPHHIHSNFDILLLSLHIPSVLSFFLFLSLPY